DDSTCLDKKPSIVPIVSTSSLSAAPSLLALSDNWQSFRHPTNPISSINLHPASFTSQPPTAPRHYNPSAHRNNKLQPPSSQLSHQSSQPSQSKSTGCPTTRAQRACADHESNIYLIRPERGPVCSEIIHRYHYASPLRLHYCYRH
ncbi:hypothetical protein K504DRAFT_484260, partial [Pleomassaria siparia CBS 279.74]